jgi:hypothetical protein
MKKKKLAGKEGDIAFKVAFLESEGWMVGPGQHPTIPRFRVDRGSMVDPHTGDIAGRGLLDDCFNKALRRKRWRGYKNKKPLEIMTIGFFDRLFPRLLAIQEKKLKQKAKK